MSYSCKYLIPTLRPVTFNHLEGLLMSDQPILERFEKLHPLFQRRLASQAVTGPFDLFRAQQQVHVVMTRQQGRLEPGWAIIEQGLAPEDIAQ